MERHIEINKGEKRVNFFYMFIGGNRTGKSTTAVKQAVEWNNARDPNEYSIIAFDPQKRLRDAIGDDRVDILIDPEDRDWAWKIKDVKDALVFLDDYKILNDKSIPAKGLITLMANRSENNVDIIMICHHPIFILSQLCSFITHFFIFRTNVMKKSFSDRIPDANDCIQSSIEINKYVKHKYGGDMEVYAKQCVSNDMKFPYIVVDTISGKRIAVNMDKKEKVK